MGQHVRDRLYWPVKVRLALCFCAEKGPERRSEGRRQVFETANAPVLHDLDFIIPDEVSWQRICKDNDRENDDCRYVPVFL